MDRISLSQKTITELMKTLVVRLERMDQKLLHSTGNAFKNASLEVSLSSSEELELYEEYECEFCSNTYATKEIMERHLVKHMTGKIHFKCDKCNAKLPSPNALKQHVKTMHKPSSKKFTCSYCQKGCKTIFSLRTHERRMHTHKNEKPFSCAFCTKSFKTRFEVHSHLMTHTKEKPFSCSKCSRPFSTSFALEQHWKRRH